MLIFELPPAAGEGKGRYVRGFSPPKFSSAQYPDVEERRWNEGSEEKGKQAVNHQRLFILTA